MSTPGPRSQSPPISRFSPPTWIGSVSKILLQPGDRDSVTTRYDRVCLTNQARRLLAPFHPVLTNTVFVPNYNMLRLSDTPIIYILKVKNKYYSPCFLRVNTNRVEHFFTDHLQTWHLSWHHTNEIVTRGFSSSYAVCIIWWLNKKKSCGFSAWM